MTAASAIISSSCDVCGWAAAFCSMLAFGTFGVPIKSETAVKLDIDPLVFQSYKSIVCFLTSFIPVLIANEPLDFTPWGIVSALFWVPGGISTVYAVKAAGLAIGIGVGSSFIVLVSFIWGIFIFHEHIHSKVGACFAVFCMMLGLMGMSYYSSPEVVDTSGTTTSSQNSSHGIPPSSSGPVYHGLNQDTLEDDQDDLPPIGSEAGREGYKSSSSRTQPDSSIMDSSSLSDNDDDNDGVMVTENIISNDDQPLYLCGIRVTKRQYGIFLAAFGCGIYGGSIMAPMKFAPPEAKGTGYLLSFGVGALVVTSFLWLVRWLYNGVRCRSLTRAYEELPSFHLREMWLPGGTAGLLWSIGNYFSLISVYFLGEGVGYPLVQTSILIAGLWGIFYFEEVQGANKISKWLISSLLTIFGILLLSYEHHEK